MMKFFKGVLFALSGDKLKADKRTVDYGNGSNGLGFYIYDDKLNIIAFAPEEALQELADQAQELDMGY